MWTYQDQIFETPPEGYYGFVYRITNTLSGKQYIGKKWFFSTKTKQVKKKKKRFKVESDWKTYYGSNKYLLEEVAAQGEEHFAREILRLCVTKSECSYFETKYQFEFGVLEDPNKFYNEWIMVRVHRKHVAKTFANV